MAEETTTVQRNLRKERIGVVTSTKMDKSITVMVERKIAPYLREVCEENHQVHGAR